MKAISVRNLSLGGEARDGSQLNFDIARGEIACVLGPNGSGKSLLVSCLCGQRCSPGASVCICGHELFSRRSRPRALALLGVVFQNSGLLRTLSVHDNVALPFLQESLEASSRLEELVGLRLELLGCRHLAHAETDSLGNGEKRCVALARALSGTTRVLVADDPTAGLSPEMQERVGELIATLVKEGALDAAILCTQDVEFALQIGTRFIFLEDPGPVGADLGVVREERTRADVMDEPRPREISAFLSRRAGWQS